MGSPHFGDGGDEGRGYRSRRCCGVFSGVGLGFVVGGSGGGDGRSTGGGGGGGL